MNRTIFEKQLKKAYIAESKLNAECAGLELLFRPYFTDEITVLYQPSDGFVILHDIDIPMGEMNGYKNTGVIEAFDYISKNPKHFIRS